MLSAHRKATGTFRDVNQLPCNHGQPGVHVSVAVLIVGVWVEIGVHATNTVQVSLTRVRPGTSPLRKQQWSVIEAPTLSQQRVQVWGNGRMCQHFFEGERIVARKSDAILRSSSVACFAPGVILDGGHCRSGGR